MRAVPIMISFFFYRKSVEGDLTLDNCLIYVGSLEYIDVGFLCCLIFLL